MPKGNPVAAATLENLLFAYNSERNTAARYMAFSVQADKERFLGVGSLFRAVAHSEQVHASNHSRVLHLLGAELDLRVMPLVVKSTRENLLSARRLEQDEQELMYPEFARQARNDECPEAVVTFELAAHAEAEHALLFAAALDGLEDYTEKSEYYICSSCGWLTAGKNFRKCTLCSTARDSFDTVP